jgi:replicative DNA helicase
MMQTAHDTAAESMEKCLIGAILVDQDVMPSIADRITVEAFANARNRAIFNAAERCWKNRRPSDIVTVHAELANDPDIQNEQDWMSMAADLSESILHLYENGYACRGPMYADAVVAFARRRAISDAGANIVKMAHDGETVDSGLVMAEVMAGMDKFGATTEQRGPQTYDEIIPGYQDTIIAMMNGEIPNRVTATGWTALDRKLAGGLYPGELVILAARPSMGKTALALQMGHQVAKAGKHVIVFSAEMSKESLLKRAVADLMGRALDKPEYEFSGDEFNRFLQSLDRLRGIPMSIDDTPSITTAQMQVRIQNMQRRHDVGLVIFDYIELAGDQVKGDSEERRINDIVKALKRIARICNVPVLAICQLNRQVESTGNKRPMLSHLRYSGSIEQDADKVLFLYRHDYYVNQGTAQPEAGTENTAEVIVSKHRNGATGEVKLRFTAETMTFHTIDYTVNVRPWNAA